MMKLKKIIHGRGKSTSVPTTKRHYVNGKYIDLAKLSKNILCIKYETNNTQLPSIKPISISNDVKEVLEDLVKDKYDKRLFDKLKSHEKRIIQQVVQALKIDVSVHSKEDDDFHRNFEILKGELASGNDNPKVRAELKKYIVEGMHSNQIPMRECHLLLYQLSL